MQKNNEKIEKSRQLILYGNLWKALLLISLPVAFSNVIVALFNLFDIWFSKLIGKTEMAATVFVGPVNDLVGVIGTGLGIAATTLIARNIASRKYKTAKDNLAQLLLIAFISGLILLIIGTVFSTQILSLLGADGLMLQMASKYFKITIIAVPFTFFINVYVGYLRSIGKNRKIFLITFGQILIKFLLNILFVKVLTFGINGLGYATLISTLLPTSIGLYELFIKKSTMRLSKNIFKFKKTLLIAIFILSWPIIIEQMTMNFGNVLVSSMANSLGEQVLNAYGITNRINSIVFSFSTGFGVALVAVVSQNAEVGNIKRIKEAKYKAMVLSLLITLFLLIVILVNRRAIARNFTEDSATLDLICFAMSIYTSSVIPWTIMQVYFGVFRGLKRTGLTLIVSLTRLWIFRVLLLFLLLKFSTLGSTGIWLVMIISNIAATIASILIDVFAVDYSKYEKTEKDLLIEKDI